MNNRKAIAIVSISFAFLPMLLVGSTFATWAVTDDAKPFGFKINIAGQTIEPGHYLYWDGDTEGVPLTMNDTSEAGYYSYPISLSAGMTGSNKKFVIRDESDNVIVDEASGLTINFAGNYTLTNSSTGYNLTYKLYLTNNKSYTTPKAFFFDNANSNADTWSGTTMTYHGKNSLNEDIYYVDVDAKKYATNTSYAIFSDNGGNQTTNIPLSGITAGDTRYYMGNPGTHRISFEPSANWKEANAYFVAYHYNNTAGQDWWEKLQYDSNTDKYVGRQDFDDSYSGLIFIRVDPSLTSLGNQGTGYPSAIANNSKEWAKFELQNLSYSDYAADFKNVNWGAPTQEQHYAVVKTTLAD